MKKTDNRTVAERKGMEELLGFLKDPTSGADGATVQAALISHLERSLGQNETVVPTGDTMGDRLERFFDNIFVVEPPAAVPYTLEELQQLFNKTADNIANGDATNYRAIAGMTDMGEMLRTYKSLDTYARGYIYWKSINIDRARFYATLDNFDLDARFI